MKKVEGVRVGNVTGNGCSENGAPCKFQNENNLCTNPKVTIDDTAAMENLNCEQAGTANENVSKETALSANASICINICIYISQDNDPVACIRPLFSDDTLAGRGMRYQYFRPKSFIGDLGHDNTQGGHRSCSLTCRECI